MLTWVGQNSGVISVTISFLMLIVWITYLQMLFLQYRASRRAYILVTRAAGKGIRSRCLITNMSPQPVYVTSLIGTLHVPGREIELALTDLRELPEEELQHDPRSRMGQGSLGTGDYLNIGHFDEIAQAMLDANNEDEVKVAEVNQLDLVVVALTASDKLPIGAARSFQFERNSRRGTKVQPLSIATKQITQRRARKAIMQKAEYHT